MKLDITELGFSIGSEQYLQVKPTVAPTDASNILDVVDLLMEHDLIGVLLSTSHFQRYCKFMSLRVSGDIAGVLHTLSICEIIANKFQKEALRVFMSLHIDECRYSKDELADHLDKKLTVILDEKFVSKSALKVCKEIECAWNYRSTCQGLRD